MAQHMQTRILERAPEARVLIWAGQGHGQKGTPLKMMADYPSELAGEKPFSAYQLTGAGRRPGVDLLIRHPEPRYEHNRPDWLRTPERRSVRGTVEPGAEILVQLQRAAEGQTSTPVDQLLTGADGRFELLAAAGEYRLRVWSSEEEVALERRLSVGAAVEELRLALGPA